MNKLPTTSRFAKAGLPYYLQKAMLLPQGKAMATVTQTIRLRQTAIRFGNSASKAALYL